MNLEPVKVINEIARFAAPKIINQAQRNETVIKILKTLNLDPAHPPKDFDGVYNYALVEYAVYKPAPILDFFREKEIKISFWKAFNNNPSAFLEDAEYFLKWNTIGDEIREQNINIRPEIEEFYKVFVNISKRTRTPAEALNDPNFKLLPDQNPYPDEFKSLIEEKIKSFCGRQFVFDAFVNFIKNNPNGYFTVVGDAGMGKSAIAAKYVYDHHCPCYFNILSESRNRPEQFLKSIRQQFIQRYDLQDAGDADLSTLVVKISKKLLPNQRLIIVVDALDEVEQEAGAENILSLPDTLPERVYFLLTRRPYNIDKKRLRVSVPVQELDLTSMENESLSRDDVKSYINFFVNKDPEHQYTLRKWIAARNLNLETFIEQVAAKSENNFMYLRYVLPGIARGFYDDLSLDKLPDGLQDYYQVHWVRMGMDTAPKEMRVIILFILVEIGTPIPCEMIADIAQQDEYDVQTVLDEWVEYLKDQEIDGETCYNFYHASFLDFLKGKRVLDSQRKIFKDVNQRIVDYWERVMVDG